MNEKTKITVVGLGYVGMSLAVLIGRTQDVVALDIDPARVAMVNSGRPTVIDSDMEEVMANEPLSLVATTDPAEAYQGADFVIVATPTDYDPTRDCSQHIYDRIQRTHIENLLEKMSRQINFPSQVLTGALPLEIRILKQFVMVMQKKVGIVGPYSTYNS